MFVVRVECSFFDNYESLEGPFDTFAEARSHAEKALSTFVDYWGHEPLMICPVNSEGDEGFFSYAIVLDMDRKDESTVRNAKKTWNPGEEMEVMGSGDTYTAKVSVMKVRDKYDNTDEDGDFEEALKILQTLPNSWNG